MLIAGGVLLSAGYTTSFALSFAGAAVSALCATEPGQCGEDPNRWFWGILPVAGGWVQVGYASDSFEGGALYGVPALVQTAGLALLIAGSALRHETSSRIPLVGVSPIPGGGTLSLSGRF